MANGRARRKYWSGKCMLGSYSYYGEGSGLVALGGLHWVGWLRLFSLCAGLAREVDGGWRLDLLITLVQSMVLIEV